MILSVFLCTAKENFHPGAMMRHDTAPRPMIVESMRLTAVTIVMPHGAGAKN
jgi:hypothetical protein